jgi:hypothetical protein
MKQTSKVINIIKTLKIDSDSIDSKLREELLKLNGMISHSYIKTIKKQIELGITDIYDRYIDFSNNCNPKDSSSLKSFCIKYGEEHGNILFKLKKEKTAHTIEGYISKYGIEEGTLKFRELSKSRSISLENCKRRYGEAAGIEFHTNYWNNTSFGMSKEKFKKRFGDNWEIEYNNYVDFCKYRASLEYLTDKHGDDVGLEKWNDINESKRNKLSKETFITECLSDGCSYDDIISKIDDRWNNNSKSSFVKRYGEIDGEKKYQLYISKCRSSNKLCPEYYHNLGLSDDDEIRKLIIAEQIKRNVNVGYRSSKIATKTLKPMAEGLVSRGYCNDYRLEDEFRIDLTDKEIDISGNYFYFYDLTIPELNLIIEYHGERFHDKVDYDSTKNMTYDSFIDNFNKDLFKKFVAEQRGFMVFVIREWEIKQDLLSIFEYFEKEYKGTESWIPTFV